MPPEIKPDAPTVKGKKYPHSHLDSVQDILPLQRSMILFHLLYFLLLGFCICIISFFLYTVLVPFLLGFFSRLALMPELPPMLVPTPAVPSK